MSFASLRRVLRSARKGLCSTCSKARYPQLEAAGAGHVGCLIYTIETLGQLIKDDHNVTPLHVAARKGQIAILIYLVENNFVKGIDRAKNGATPAHDAAGTGNLDCLRYVLSHTMASASDIDNNNATPLHWAVQSGHRKVVQWLVAQGHAPIDATTTGGITPIHLAASRNHFDILRWLTGYAYKHYPKPRKLINARDKNGCTPLYHAAQGGRGNIIRWLAEKAGGDPTIRSHESLAPLHAATIGGHIDAVKYLFQFGSASAPGGMRTEEGACALHFAASEGHIEILKWLLEQKECNGNERDYYQSTPLHDAAEHGHLRIVQTLCEKGADYTLTDIEGNAAKDLAEKSGHSKCVKYLASQMKGKLPPHSTGKRSGGIHRRGIHRSKRSSGEVMDNYRNAPPHQIPVNVFEGEDDEIPEAFVLGEWETLRDLMGDQELQDETIGVELDIAAEEKKRKLEEDMRRELEERKKKKMELLKKEREVEMEIRERLLAEEEAERTRSGGQSLKRSDRMRRSDDVPPSHMKVLGRRLSLPSNLAAKDTVTNGGLVKKRTQALEKKNSPAQNGKNIFAKFLSRKTGPTSDIRYHFQHSQSWDSDLSIADEIGNPCVTTKEVDLPEPPPLPTIEYLLGKRPVNLRRRAVQTFKDQIKAKAATMQSKDDSCDSDSHSSVGSAPSDHYKHRRRKHKRKKSTKTTKTSEDLLWHKSLTGSSRASPGQERFPKSLLDNNGKFAERMPYQPKIDLDSAFDEVTNELEALANSPTAIVPAGRPSFSLTRSSISGKKLTGENIPIRQTSKAPITFAQKGNLSNLATQKGLKRGGPKLLPHQRNAQETNVDNDIAGSSIEHNVPSQKSSKLVMSSLQNKSLLMSTNPDVTQIDQESVSMDIDEIESQLNAMKLMLEHAAGSTVSSNNGHPPSPENVRVSDEASDSDSGSTEYTSSSDEDSDTSSDNSISEDSSNEERERELPSRPKHPIMARNIGMAGSSRPKGVGFNRARMLSRYPRLLGKRVIYLDTVKEVSEEIIYLAKSNQEKAVTFYRLKTEQRYMKSWRKYIELMRSACLKADRIVRRRRRELLAKSFYAWIQVRNMGAADMDNACAHYRIKLLQKMFHSWRQPSLPLNETSTTITRSTSQQLLNAEEKYLSWLNKQLLGCNFPEVKDIGQSLADGISIIKALSHASSTKAPKYNPNPKLPLHRQDNWKMAHEYMKMLGINVRGVEPADLANVLPAAIHNMFNQILKWQEHSPQ